MYWNLNWEDILHIFSSHHNGRLTQVHTIVYLIQKMGSPLEIPDSVIVQNKVISFHTSRIVLTSLDPPFLEYKQVYSLFLSQDERKGFRLKVRILFRTFIVRFNTLSDLVVDKIRNMEHSGTFRNIPEHRIIMIIMRKICKIKFQRLKRPAIWKRQSWNYINVIILWSYFKMQLKSSRG